MPAMKSFPGTFIVFEGIDGCGKGTQARMLKDYFESQGREVVSRHEPTYESEPSLKIKQILRNHEKVSLYDLALLYVADRKWNTETHLLPALHAGKIVIEDRYKQSTIAFESTERIEEMIELNKDFPDADLTIILKVPGEMCLERIGKRKEGYELFDSLEKMSKIWERYETFPSQFPNTYIVDGTDTPEEVSARIKKLL